MAAGSAPAGCSSEGRCGPLWAVLAVLLITLLGAALRLHFIDHPMRYDEAFNFLQYSSRSPEHIITHYAPNNHVLHSLLVRVASHWLGTSPPALRAIAFLAGVGLIPLTAWLTWRLFGDRRAAVLAALLMAASSQMVEYSTNSRGYGLMTLWAALATLCTLRLLETPQRWRWWIAWAVSAAAGAFTMPTMVYAFAGLAVVLALAAWRTSSAVDRRALVRGLLVAVPLCGVLTLLAYLPALLAQGLSATWATQSQTHDVWGLVVGGPWGMLREMWDGWNRHAGGLWTVLLIAGLAGYQLRLLRRPTARRALPVVVFVVAWALVLLQGALLRDRAWMFVLPLAFAAAAYGLVHLAPRRLPRRPAAVASSIMMLVAAVATGLAIRNVHAQRYLCSEPNVVVDIEDIVAECRAYGAERCALIMRYTPALGYYVQQQDLPSLQLPRDADRVYIMADHMRSLAEQWPTEAELADAFHAPRPVRRLTQCTLYAADRREWATKIRD